MATLRSVLIGLITVAVVLISCVACAPAPPVATTGSDAVSMASPAVEISGPWPAGLTPEQQKAAVAALAAFDSYVRIVSATQQSPIGIGGDPSQPWEPEIRKYVADPAADTMVEVTESLARGGVHVVIPRNYHDIQVIALTAHSATVAACLGPGGVTAVDVPKQAGIFRLRSFTEKGWLVDHDEQSEPPVPC